MQDSTKEKLRTLFTSKQFYIALALCVAIAAIGAYYANGLRQIGKLTETEQATESNTKKAAEPAEEDVNNNVTGMQDVRGEDATAVIPGGNIGTGDNANPEAQDVDNTPEQVTQAKPTYFALPLSTDMGLDYSREVMVFNSTTGDYRTHIGIDFKGAVGDTVKAVAAGKVLAVYDDVLWGAVMEIDHGAGIVATYAGLGRGSTLAEGTVVEINDTIGNLGTVPIESDEDAHIHLEIRVNGELQDPLEVMGRSGENQ